MAIQDILQALEDQAQADCAECLGEAEAHAKHIVDEAEREAAGIRDRYLQNMERTAGAEAAQKVNAARLESKMLISSVKGDGLDNVFTQAQSQLGSLRSRPDYPQALEAMLAEALDGASDDAVVKVNPDDVAAAQSAAGRIAPGVRVEGDASVVGGVLVELDGGTILRRNTLDDRLGRAREYVQNDVARVLLA
jgi:vacuolar-type H+-ATPase subunit E/Vma4